MSKKSRLPQSRRHILVYDEDWQFIHSLCGPDGARADIGVGNFIRELIHGKVGELRAKYNSLLDHGVTESHAASIQAKSEAGL